MPHNSMKRGVPALGLIMILMTALGGCSNTARQAQIDAGARIGQAAAGVALDRQPDECGQDWPVLGIPGGEDKAATIRRYDAYVLGRINGRASRCYWFNENQRIGLQGQ